MTNRDSKPGNESIAVRPARPADAAQWARMRQALWPEADPGELESETGRFFAGALREPRAVLVAVGHDDRLVGMAELSIRSYAEGCATDRVGFLEGWFVAEDCRRRGIGRALVDASLRWAEAQGCTEFASDALLENETSREAHLALGFEETALLRCFRRDLRPGSTGGGSEPGDPIGSSIAVLAFDVFGTVVDWRRGIIDAAAAVGRRKNLDADWAAFADGWREAYGPSMDRVRRGELPWTNLDRLHRQSLDGLVDRFGLGSLDETDRRELVRAWHRLPPWPDSVPGLLRLKRRFTIVPLSNGNVALLTEMAKLGGLPWDAILSAELVHRYKPDPETYRSVPEFFDVPPAAVMMVAAHPTDLAAAAAVGLETAYVHRPLEPGPERPVPWPDPGAFDLSVASLLELADRLGA